MLSRRGFINTTIGAGLSMAAPGVQEGAAQPRRRTVDAQVHLWKASGPDRPWNPGAVPQLPEPFGYERLLGMMDEAGVDRVVIVPPSWEGDRNDYALEAAERHPDRFAVMGRIALADPASRGRIATWKNQPGMVGIRLTFLRAQSAWLSDGTADWIWPAAEQAGIPIMFLAAGSMPAIARIAERHPQLALIADHMGLSADFTKANPLEGGIDQTVALAKYPNVSVKLSSAPSFSSQPYPFRDMTVHIRRLYDAYGPRRCYWGTDITNSLAKATYRQRITHFIDELDFLSADDKDWIMGRAILARLGWA